VDFETIPLTAEQLSRDHCACYLAVDCIPLSTVVLVLLAFGLNYDVLACSYADIAWRRHLSRRCW